MALHANVGTAVGAAWRSIVAAGKTGRTGSGKNAVADTGSASIRAITIERAAEAVAFAPGRPAWPLLTYVGIVIVMGSGRTVGSNFAAMPIASDPPLAKAVLGRKKV